MKRKMIMAGVAGAVLLVGVSFAAGISYEKARVAARSQLGSTPFGTRGISRGMMGMQGGFTTGEILSKDANSITLKLQNGSSKIVLLASSTAITKSISGSFEDLSVGAGVMVVGTPNTDGSLTAQSVQLRPAGTPQGVRN